MQTHKFEEPKNVIRCRALREEATIPLSLKEIVTDAKATLKLRAVVELHTHCRYWNAEPWLAPTCPVRIDKVNNFGNCGFPCKFREFRRSAMSRYSDRGYRANGMEFSVVIAGAASYEQRQCEQSRERDPHQPMVVPRMLSFNRILARGFLPITRHYRRLFAITCQLQARRRPARCQLPMNAATKSSL
jgi:hypothetical protein